MHWVIFLLTVQPAEIICFMPSVEYGHDSRLEIGRLAKIKLKQVI
jgi:hypothetical protein